MHYPDYFQQLSLRCLEIRLRRAAEAGGGLDQMTAPPESSGSLDIPSGGQCLRRPPIAWAIFMAEAHPRPSTSTDILDWSPILAVLTTTGLRFSAPQEIRR